LTIRLARLISVVFAASVLITGCATGAPAGGQSAGAPAQPAQPKKMVVGSREAAPALSNTIDSKADVIEELISAGLVGSSPLGDSIPQLAEAVPTIDNGLWKILPGGKMETTWKIREGAKWHDGVPITSEDALFAVRLGQDRELPDFAHAAIRLIDTVRAPDDRTIVVEWKDPYIQADILFSGEAGLPLPRHLLEDAYLNNKQSFTQHRYWTHEFVHAGPFKVKEFVPTERLVLEAFPDYILGRPKIDELEVRFIPDANTLVANMLAGQVHATIGSNFSVGIAQQAAERWPEGKMAVYPIQSVNPATPQFINPDPAALADVRLRRALAHAFDRDSLNEVINRGVAPPPSGFLIPVGAPEFPQVKPFIQEYPYDTRRATQLIEEMGYTKSGDTYHDASGKELSIDFLGSQGGAEEQAILFMADSWQRIGVKTPTRILASNAIEAEARATRPAFAIGSGTFLMSQPRRLEWLHSRLIPTAADRWRNQNRTRYSNPELDAMIDKFFVTLQPQERIDIFKQVAKHFTENEIMIVAYHEVHAVLISNRVQNVTPRTSYAQTYEAHKWDIN
jgi:peptide/nickel transport system substrate-binding protein